MTTREELEQEQDELWLAEMRLDSLKDEIEDRAIRITLLQARLEAECELEGVQ